MSEVRDLRRSLLEDHANRRIGFGRATDAPLTAHLRSDTCGDEITIRARVSDGRIQELGWDGIGCQICMASASMLAGSVEGLPVAQLASVTEVVARIIAADADDDLLDESRDLTTGGADAPDLESLAGIGRYPLRARCALLPWRAAAAALADAAI